MAEIAVIGAGSWGTAVAISLAHQGHPVSLWARDKNHLQDMKTTRENQRYLPGIPFPKSLTLIDDLSQCWQQEQVLLAIPSHAFAEILAQIPPTIPQLAWLTKGLEAKSHQLLSDLVSKHCGQIPMAMISGPSFAKEVAMGKPTALVVAANHSAHAKHWQRFLHSSTMRVYTTNDLIGVQVCASLKNVLAIACGISDGLDYGANSRAAIITRGLAEMQTLGLAMGGQSATFAGLAGLGDLVLTCTDNQSRNRRFGLLIGQGHSPQSACAEIKQVVEGLDNVSQINQVARLHQLELPIAHAVYQVLYQNQDPKKAAQALLNRPIY